MCDGVTQHDHRGVAILLILEALQSHAQPRNDLMVFLPRQGGGSIGQRDPPIRLNLFGLDGDLRIVRDFGRPHDDYLLLPGTRIDVGRLKVRAERVQYEADGREPGLFQ